MNIDIANGMSRYIDDLFNLNMKFIELCGFDFYTNTGEKEILDLYKIIPRIVPYYFDKKTKKLYLQKKKSILEYGKDIEYLESDYAEILSANYAFLRKAKIFRNYSEHEMHQIKFLWEVGSSNNSFSFAFQFPHWSIRVDSFEFINFIKQINCLFSKIVSDIIDFAKESKYVSYPYMEKLKNINFKGFNSSYDSFSQNKYMIERRLKC